MGSDDVDPPLIYLSGIEGCLPHVFRVFCMQNFLVRHCSCTKRIVISDLGKIIH